MKNNQLLLLTVAGAALSALSVTAQAKRPNIVLVIADDCRRGDLGCYGSPDAVTPNIDRLASEGLKFTRFFQATAMSSPTRHCLLTGLYPVKSGAYPNHTFIKDGVKTLPYYLKNAGYRVALQGKRHIAPLESFPFEYLSGDYKNLNIPDLESFIAEVTEKDQPFFLYLASNDPHSPWTRGDRSLFDAGKLTPPPTLVDTKELRENYVNYLAEINQLDTDVGKVDALLKKYRLDENTIFIFTSEQGHQFPFGKWTCYDAGLQTGFIVRWQGVTTPGAITDALCEYVDVTPTLLDIAGAPDPGNLDGKSFLPVIKGKKKKFKEYVFGAQTTRGIANGSPYYGIRSVRNERYSYILNLTPEAAFKNIITREKDPVWASWEKKAQTDSFARQQVSRYQYRPAEELYDVVNDPYQLHNLAGDKRYASEVKKLRRRLLKWMESQGDRGQATELEALEHQWNEKKVSKKQP